MEEYLTVEEISKNLKLRKETVLIWIRTGKLKAIKLGKAYRITENDLNAYLETKVSN